MAQPSIGDADNPHVLPKRTSFPGEIGMDDGFASEASLQEISRDGSLDPQALVTMVNLRLESLRDVPAQLKALQEIPKQLICVVCTLNKMESRLAKLTQIPDGSACDAPSPTASIVSKQVPEADVLAYGSEMSEYSPSTNMSFRRQLRIPSAMPVLHRPSALIQSSSRQPSRCHSTGTPLGRASRPWAQANLAPAATTPVAMTNSSPSYFKQDEHVDVASASPHTASNSRRLSFAVDNTNGYEKFDRSKGNEGSDGQAVKSLAARSSQMSSSGGLSAKHPTQRSSQFSAICPPAPSGHRPSTISTSSTSSSFKQSVSQIWSLTTLGTNQTRAPTRTFCFEPDDPSPNESVFANTVLAPDSRVRLVWDVLLVLNTTLAGSIIPIMLIYYRNRSSPGFPNFLQTYVFDLFWLIDIIFNFRTGFFADGVLVKAQRNIAKRYARRWLLPDLVSACPLALFNRSSSLYAVVCILKLPRLVQVCPRLARLRSECWGGTIPTEILILVALMSHFLACFWRVALGADGAETIAEHTIADTYVSDLYWVSMTLTGVGYGDVVPVGSASRLYAIGCMLLGSVVFGAIITATTLIVQKILNKEEEARIKELTRFMVRRNVPKELQRRVQHNLRQHFKYKAATAMSPHLLMSLSPAMQKELCLSVLSNTVMNFPLFRHAQRSFVAELAQAHLWEQVLTGDLVADEGHAVEQVVFLVHGHLQAWVPPCYDIGELDVSLAEWTRINTKRLTGISKCLEMHAGAWFGESCLFDTERVYTSLIVAASDCELAVLAATEYACIMQKYPWLWERQQQIEQGIRDDKIDLADLRYQEPESEKGDEPKPLKNWSMFAAFRRFSGCANGDGNDAYYGDGEGLSVINESEEPSPVKMVPC